MCSFHIYTSLSSLKHMHKDKDLFIGQQEFVVGYSKAPEQPQSSAMPICHSHAVMRTGREPSTIRIAAYRSSPRYALSCDALRHGRRNYITFEACAIGWSIILHWLAWRKWHFSFTFLQITHIWPDHDSNKMTWKPWIGLFM